MYLCVFLRSFSCCWLNIFIHSCLTPSPRSSILDRLWAILYLFFGRSVESTNSPVLLIWWTVFFLWIMGVWHQSFHKCVQCKAPESAIWCNLSFLVAGHCSLYGYQVSLFAVIYSHWTLYGHSSLPQFPFSIKSTINSNSWFVGVC